MKANTTKGDHKESLHIKKLVSHIHTHTHIGHKKRFDLIQTQNVCRPKKKILTHTDKSEHVFELHSKKKKQI